MSKSRSEIAYRMIDELIHEVSHIWYSVHNNDFIAKMNGIKDILYKSGGAEKYYAVAAKFISNKVEAIGDFPDDVVVGIEGDSFLEGIDKIAGSLEKNITDRRISYKNGGKNVLTVRKDIGKVIFNLSDFMDMNVRYDLVSPYTKKNTTLPSIIYKGLCEETQAEILDIISEYLNTITDQLV